MARVLAHPALQAVVMLHLADGSDGTTFSVNGGWVGQLIQFGFLGLVFIDIVGTHKFLVPAWTVKRELDAVCTGYDAQLRLKDEQIASLKEDNGLLKEANGQLQSLTQERLIPALVQATEVSRAYVAELARGNDGGRRGS